MMLNRLWDTAGNDCDGEEILPESEEDTEMKARR